MKKVMNILFIFIITVGYVFGQSDISGTSIPGIWPIQGGIGRITLNFGQNSNPFTGQTFFHNGIDISTGRIGDPIVSTADGQVLFAGFDYDAGNNVIIRHKYGYSTRYAHMLSFRVQAGQYVRQGEVIGYIGNTGLATGPHLHYEVQFGSDVIDPSKYLNLNIHHRWPERQIENTFVTGIENAFVYTNNLQIKDAPSMNGNVIGSISRQTITIYDRQGTRKFENGVWDYWYKISKKHNQWVNAFFVATYPIYFRYNLRFGGKNYKILNIYENGTVDYFVFTNWLSYTHRTDKEIFGELIDNPSFRISELIKDINRQIGFDIEMEYDPNEFSPIFNKDISSLKLLYGINVNTDLQTLYEILGPLLYGGRLSKSYSIIDHGRYCTVTFHLNSERTGLSAITFDVRIAFWLWD